MKLFDSLELAPGLTLPNRVVMAPLTRDRAGEGNVPTDLMVEYYRQRASFGLVIHDGTIEVEASPLVQSVIDDASVTREFTADQRAQFVAELAAFRGGQQSEIDYGSRILFRQQLVNRMISR